MRQRSDTHEKMLLALFVAIFFVATTVQGANISFTATDPTDVTDADFDITSFGAEDNGNIITFWMEVKGNINTHPSDGYLNGYEIAIEDISMVAMWVNSSNYTVPVIYLSTESGSYSILSPGQYVISGGRLEFHIDSSFFSHIGDNYTVDVYTFHFIGSTPETSLKYDEAAYSHYASGGSSGSQSTGGTGGIPWYWWLIIGLIIVAIVVVVILLVVQKSKQMQQYPPPQQPPQYPPQYPPPPEQ